MSYCKMHIDKCIRFYRVVKRLIYCGSVRLCQFDSFWIPFNTTNRVIRVAWIVLNAKLTFLLHICTPAEKVSLSPLKIHFPWDGLAELELTKLHNELLCWTSGIIPENVRETDLITLLFCSAVGGFWSKRDAGNLSCNTNSVLHELR